MPQSLLLGVLGQGLALTFSASVYQMLGLHARIFLPLGINKKKKKILMLNLKMNQKYAF